MPARSDGPEQPTEHPDAVLPGDIRLTEPTTLRALAHPFRRRLLDSLSADGPATVGQLAERTGQAVGSVSHHLKVLQTAGVVAPAPDLARDQRESWWRRVHSISWGGATGSDAERTAVEAATDVLTERHWQLLNDYRRNADSLPQWADASFASDGWLRLTPAELHAFGEELRAVVNRWRRYSDELHQAGRPGTAGERPVGPADPRDSATPLDSADPAASGDGPSAAENDRTTVFYLLRGFPARP